jgi:hypothetical protein
MAVEVGTAQPRTIFLRRHFFPSLTVIHMLRMLTMSGKFSKRKLHAAAANRDTRSI